MISEEHRELPHVYPTLTPPTVSETLEEHSTPIRHRAEGSGRQRTPSESNEIAKEMQELRRRDEEEYHRKQQEVRRRIDHHLEKNGGDLALLMSQHVPHDVKCVQLTSFGPNKNIQTTRVPLPLPMKHEVLIRAYSCGVNFHDIMTRNGFLDNWVRSLKPPFIMGSEVAGEVVGLGKNVTDLNLGDRVMALPERKAWSEFVVCRSDHCFKIPENMNYHDAVALTVDGIVAYSLLFPLGNLSPGKALLLHSTFGGLSNMVTQMTRNVPNTRIFKIAANKEGQGETFDEVVHLIEHDADYVSEIRHTSPHGVDLVLDCQYEDNFNRDFNLLRPLGRYILFGTQSAVNRGFFDSARSWWSQDKISPLKLYEENKSICGFNLRNLLYFQKDRPYIRDVFCKICKMWQDGDIQPAYDCILQFDDFGEALHRMQEQGLCGKILLDPIKTKEEAFHERDYFMIAERNVTQRRKQQQSLLGKLRIPEPGELVRDKELVEEESRARQPTQEELQRQLQGQQQFPGLNPPAFPKSEESRGIVGTIVEKLTQSSVKEPEPPRVAQTIVEQQMAQPVEIRPIGAVSAEPPIVYDSSTGKTVYNVPPQETLLQPPAVSPYSVESVLSNISTSTEQPSTLATAPSVQAVSPPESLPVQPTLTTEKVELTVPMSQKEAEQLKEEIPAALMEEKKHQHGFIEKLRETFSSHRSE